MACCEDSGARPISASVPSPAVPKNRASMPRSRLVHDRGDRRQGAERGEPVGILADDMRQLRGEILVVETVGLDPHGRHAERLQLRQERVAAADAVIVGVAQHGNPFQVQLLDHEVGQLTRLVAVVGQQPEGPLVPAGGDARVARAEHDEGHPGALGRFHARQHHRAAPAAEHRFHPVADQALHGEHGLRGIAVVVGDVENDFAPADAACVVDLLHRHLDALQHPGPVGCAAAGEPRDIAELDVVGSRRSGQGCRRQQPAEQGVAHHRVSRCRIARVASASSEPSVLTTTA